MHIKQQEIKEPVAVFHAFCKKHFQNLNLNVNQIYMFYLILVGIPSSLILQEQRGSFYIIEKNY